MNRIRWIGSSIALGGVLLLGGCVGVPGPAYDGGYYGGGYSEPYYGSGGVVVNPAPVYIEGGTYYGRPGYYGQPGYYGGRPAYQGRPGYYGRPGDRPGYSGRPGGRPPVAGGLPGRPGVVAPPVVMPPAGTPGRPALTQGSAIRDQVRRGTRGNQMAPADAP